jgi:hypothetical protein
VVVVKLLLLLLLLEPCTEDDEVEYAQAPERSGGGRLSANQSDGSALAAAPACDE